MSAPEGGGGGGGGVVHLPQLLPYEAVFRIEVSLSSQTTSAIVMRTTARLYSLEGAQSGTSSTGGGGGGGGGEGGRERVVNISGFHAEGGACDSPQFAFLPPEIEAKVLCINTNQY